MSRPAHLAHAQGLRALAIAAIVFYHLQAGLCPCGYFGVDVFLVLTGYFLARNDLPKLASGGIGARGYLLKKAWRIMPPWLAVALPTCLFCCFVMGYFRLAPVFCTAGSAALCFSNEYVAASGSYFNPAIQENPLMHLWYIGLTLQIYILTPAVALLCRKSRKGGRIAMVVAGGASLALYYLMTSGQQYAPVAMATRCLQGWLSPYYSLLTRAWEPLAGAALTLLPTLAEGASKWRGALWSLAGLALVVVPMYLFETSSAVNYAAVAGACLLLRYGAAGPVGALLSCAPMRALGAVSFSLYLVHWPVFAIWKYMAFDTPGLWGYTGMLLLSAVLAFLLWRYVETRCGQWAAARTPAQHKWLPIAAMATVGPLGLALGLVTALEYVWPSALDRDIACNLHTIPPNAPAADMRGFDTSAFANKPQTIGSGDAPARFALLGDSHAWHLVHGLSLYCDKAGLRGVFLNNSCVPAWDFNIFLNGGNARWDESSAHALLHWLKEQKDIRCVVISVYWNWRLLDDSGRDWDFRPIAYRDCPAHVRKGVVEMCRRIRALGKEIIVLHDTPNFSGGSDPYDEAERCAYLHRPCPVRISTREQYADCNKEAYPLLQELEEKGLARVIPVAHVLERGGVYPFRDTDGRFLYRDTNHLSTHGSELVARLIFPAIQEGCGTKPAGKYRCIPQTVSCFDHTQAPKAKEADLRGFDRAVFPQAPRSLGSAEVPADFVLVGDSHAWHLAQGLDACCSEAGVRGLFLNNSCLPAWDCISVLNDGKETWGEEHTAAFLQWLAEHGEIRCVVISNRWPRRMVVSDAQDWNHTPLPYSQAPDHIRQGIVAMCRKLRAMGKELIVLRDTPCFPDEADPYAEAERCARTGRELPHRTTTHEYYDKVNSVAAPLFRMLEEEGLAHIVDAAPALERDGSYPFRDTDGRFFYRDTNHLSTLGSLRVARHIFPAIRQCAKAAVSGSQPHG